MGIVYRNSFLLFRGQFIFCWFCFSAISETLSVAPAAPTSECRPSNQEKKSSSQNVSLRQTRSQQRNYLVSVSTSSRYPKQHSSGLAVQFFIDASLIRVTSLVTIRSFCNMVLVRRHFQNLTSHYFKPYKRLFNYFGKNIQIWSYLFGIFTRYIFTLILVQR